MSLFNFGKSTTTAKTGSKKKQTTSDESFPQPTFSSNTGGGLFS